jgi:hypothetical protein
MHMCSSRYPTKCTRAMLEQQASLLPVCNSGHKFHARCWKGSTIPDLHTNLYHFTYGEKEQDTPHFKLKWTKSNARENSGSL